MHQLMLVAALAAEPAAEESQRPFIERGGVHLILIQASHSLVLASVFAVYSDTGPYAPLSTGERVAGVIGIVAGTNLAAFLMAHWLRPSVGAAWLTALLSVTSVLLGLELGWPDQLRRRTCSEALDPDYAVSMLLTAPLGVASSLIALLPHDRSRLHLGTTALIAAGALTLGLVTGIGYARWQPRTVGSQEPRTALAVAPLAGALLLRLLQAVFLPDLFVSPTVVPGGAGFSFSTTW